MAILTIPASSVLWGDIILADQNDPDTAFNKVIAVWPANQNMNPNISGLVTFQMQFVPYPPVGDWHISYPPSQLVTVQRG
jgi:hypothetical protein